MRFHLVSKGHHLSVGIKINDRLFCRLFTAVRLRRFTAAASLPSTFVLLNVFCLPPNMYVTMQPYTPLRNARCSVKKKKKKKRSVKNEICFSGLPDTSFSHLEL